MAFIGFAPSYIGHKYQRHRENGLLQRYDKVYFQLKTNKANFEKGLKNKNSNQVFNDLTYESLRFR